MSTMKNVSHVVFCFVTVLLFVVGLGTPVSAQGIQAKRGAIPTGKTMAVSPRSATTLTAQTRQKQISYANWAGKEFYGATNEFTSIQADWTVPCIAPDPRNTSHQPESSSIWIGLGGVMQDELTGNKENLVQTGTEQDILYDAQGAHTDYYAWIENLGLPSPKNQNLIAFHLPCGHRVHAEIVSPNTISIRDLDGTGFFPPTPVGPAAGMSTAEFIVERPTRNKVHTNLANFQHITLSNCKVFDRAVRDYVSVGADNKTITMVDDHYRQMVEVLPVSASDTSFTMKWVRSGL